MSKGRFSIIPEVEESEIDDLEHLTKSEDEESEELSDESSEGVKEVSEEKSSTEAEDQDEPQIGNEVSLMPKETYNMQETVVSLGSKKKELHPIWLRERVSEKEHLDANTEQRLFDPSFLKDITIKEVKIDNNLLKTHQ